MRAWPEPHERAGCPQGVATPRAPSPLDGWLAARGPRPGRPPMSEEERAREAAEGGGGGSGGDASGGAAASSMPRPYDRLRLPEAYSPVLSTPRERAAAVAVARDALTAALQTRLRLLRVPTPLLVRADSGVNDTLDRDGSRTAVRVECGLKEGHANAQGVRGVHTRARECVCHEGLLAPCACKGSVC